MVTLNDILNKASQTAATGVPADGSENNDSAALREMCLQEALGCDPDNLQSGISEVSGCIRDWDPSWDRNSN